MGYFGTGRYKGSKRNVRKASRLYRSFLSELSRLAAERAKVCPSAGPLPPLPIIDGYGGYGFIDKMIPQDPQLTMEQDPPRLCLNIESEQALQNQRKFAMYIGGPSVVIAGHKLKGPFGLFVMGLGVACTLWHHTAYKQVKAATGVE